MKRFAYILFSLLFVFSACTDRDEEGGDVRIKTLYAETWPDQVVLHAEIVAGQNNVSEVGFRFSKAMMTDGTAGEKYPGTDLSARFSVTVSDLDAGTDYYARPYAIVGGNEVLGVEIAVRTSPETPLVLESSSVYAVTPSSAQVGIVKVEDNLVQIREFGLYFWTGGPSDELPEGALLQTVPGAPANVLEDGEEIRVPLENLIPNETYQVRAYARNSADPVFLDDIVIETPVIMPVGVTTGAEAGESTTMTNFVVEGNRLTDRGNEPEHLYCGIYYSTSPIPDEAPECDRIFALLSEESDLFTIEVSGLEHETTYYVRAFASNRYTAHDGNEYGYETLGEQIAITTAAPLAAQVTTEPYGSLPEDEQAYEFPTSGFVFDPVGLSFSCTLHATGVNTWAEPVGSYGFQLAVTEAGLDDPALRLEIPASNLDDQAGFSADAMGLRSGQRYYFRAFVNDGIGEVHSFKTPVYGGRLLRYDASGPDGSRPNPYLVDDPAGKILLYFELKGVPVLIGGERYMAYMLDRNLGAVRTMRQLEGETSQWWNMAMETPAVAGIQRDACGYYYQWGNKYPSAAPGVTDNHAAANKLTGYGWSNTGGVSGRSVWSGEDDESNPCPKGYVIPTREQLKAITDAINASGTLQDTYNSRLLLGKTGARSVKGTNDGKIDAGNGLSLWCSDIATVANANRLELWQSQAVKYSNFDLNNGLPVRCIRLEKTNE